MESKDKDNNIQLCECGGGQSCIVDRRFMNDFVHEDYVFKKYNLPIRKHCFQKPTKEQTKAMQKELNGAQVIVY